MDVSSLPWCKCGLISAHEYAFYMAICIENANTSGVGTEARKGDEMRESRASEKNGAMSKSIGKKKKQKKGVVGPKGKG